MPYSAAHRHFLQVMTLRRSLDEEEAVKVMRECCQQYGVNASQLETFVDELNEELEVVQLALRSTVEEREDGDYPCLVLVNMMAGEATRALSSFSKQELNFMQHLVGTIASLENGELDVNMAINIGLSLPQKMKPGSTEKLLERLIEENWLIKNTNRRGVITVSLSALIIDELSTYLEETHGRDVLKCFFCTKVTFKGFKCKLCNTGVHRDCGSKYWANCTEGNTCPKEGCNAILELPSPPSHSKRRRLTQARKENEDDNEEVEEEEEEEEEEVAVRSERRRSTRRKDGETSRDKF